MSNLKDTDIDDLIRRASDKYPLRTDSADWDRMAAALDKEPPPTTNIAETDDKRRKRRFFWLFLLLPLAGAGYFVFHHGGNTARPAMAGRSFTQAAHGGGAEAQSKTGGNVAETATGGTPADQATAGNTAQAAMKVGTQANQEIVGNTAQTSTGGHATVGRTQVPGKTNAIALDGIKGTVSDGGTTVRNRVRNGKSSSRSRNNGSAIGNEGGNQSVAGRGDDNSFASGGQRPGGEEMSEDRLFYDLRRASISRDFQLAVKVTAPVAKKDTSIVKAKPQRTRHFYAGLLAAPDLSTVKMQSVKGVGSTFGILLGYSLNQRWSIESGVYVDRKKYYTDGEYFNTKEVNLPRSVDLLNVNGICYMWEIPLNIRYNFNPGSKTAWFATAGFSTYLMSHEKYAYGWKWYGGSNVWDSTWNFHQSSQYPFSIINLSAGFEQRLGKVGNLRVEPYVRLPLTGLGTGKLPIMSAGVNIGITRRLW